MHAEDMHVCVCSASSLGAVRGWQHARIQWRRVGDVRSVDSLEPVDTGDATGFYPGELGTLWHWCAMLGAPAEAPPTVVPPWCSWLCWQELKYAVLHEGGGRCAVQCLSGTPPHPVEVGIDDWIPCIGRTPAFGYAHTASGQPVRSSLLLSKGYAKLAGSFGASRCCHGCPWLTAACRRAASA